jgi:murein DD-endopeptidase / murein LD-carboxypeptidase
MSGLDIARAAIAERALEQVGTPFRLFGRTAGLALDCVGLVLIALGSHSPIGAGQLRYSLRGDQLQKARDCFSHSDFSELCPTEAPQPGDLALVPPGPSQLHFMIGVSGGWVHADAGLGRTVLRPGALPWPRRCIWRLNRI